MKLVKLDMKKVMSMVMCEEINEGNYGEVSEESLMIMLTTTTTTTTVIL